MLVGMEKEDLTVMGVKRPCRDASGSYPQQDNLLTQQQQRRPFIYAERGI